MSYYLQLVTFTAVKEPRRQSHQLIVGQIQGLQVVQIVQGLITQNVEIVPREIQTL